MQKVFSTNSLHRDNVTWTYIIIFLCLIIYNVNSTQINSNVQSENLLEFNTKAYNNTMLWGTYRPQVYFGMKTRSTKPIVTGIMWYDVHDFQGIENIRHTCEMGDDVTYGWHRHDGQTYGLQRMLDKRLNILLTTEIFMNASREGSKAGDWSLRISGKSIDASKKPTTISLMFYIGTEDESLLKIDGMRGRRRHGLNNPVIINGNHKDIGKFNLFIKDVSGKPSDAWTKEEKRLEKFHVLGKQVSGHNVWQVKDFVKQSIFEGLQAALKKQLKSKKYEENPNRLEMPTITLDNTFNQKSNLIVIQKVLTPPFTMEYVLLSHEMHPKMKTAQNVKKEASKTMEENLTKIFKEKRNEFDEKFERIYRLKEKGLKKEYIEMGKYALSNLIGGIGYFSGSSIHKYEVENRTITRNLELFTAVPARSFFPRGFLWDEGFHLLITQTWNDEICKDIINHWLHLMDKDGWIAREQILGDEARSKVPEQFQVQISSHANPPTYYFPILNILDRVKKSLSIDVNVKAQQTSSSVSKQQVEADLEFLKQALPFLEKHYEWYMKTQKGELANTYRWSGRTEGHTLPSGLDDYPRGTDKPHPSERHLDLYSWMYLMSDALEQITKVLEPDSPKYKEYQKRKQTLLDNLDKYHWYSEKQMYTDYAGQPIGNETRSEYSEHIGYVNLFPLLVEMIPPTSDKFVKVLNILEDPKLLWSPYGIRSLSLSDPLFGTKENYWRGPIWIQMNYLVLRALYKTHAQSNSLSLGHVKSKEIYTRLRTALLHNLINNWRKFGTLHEQYNPLDGKGQRAYPFTGWTALILLIMAEIY